MNRQQLREAILEELAGIAPDIDTANVGDNARLRDEYDLDSMDALNLLTALHQRLGISIPERDYARMHTIGDLLEYLGEQSEH